MPKRLCLYLTDERLAKLGSNPTKRILEMVDALPSVEQPVVLNLAAEAAARLFEQTEGIPAGPPVSLRWDCPCGELNFGERCARCGHPRVNDEPHRH